MNLKNIKNQKNSVLSFKILSLQSSEKYNDLGFFIFSL